MKALFLAGGNGSRLQPLTNKVPKPMVPIMNKPLLERTMINLKKSGISEIVISNCYKPYYIRDYFGNGKELGLKIQYIVEDLPMGTGGAVKMAESQFDEPFIVFNSDILSNMDIKKMMDFHKKKHALVTIAATEVQNPSMYGVIEYDQRDYAISFKEKPKQEQITSKYINAGIYIFEPEIFKQIPPDCVVSLERDIFPKILEKKGKIAVYKSSDYWMDIGTPQKYLQAHKDIMDKQCGLLNSYFGREKVICGKNTSIHPDAQITGLAYIGDNVKIDASVFISNSVIGNNTYIAKGSTVVGSILWEEVIINGGARLMNTIVLSNCTIGRNQELFDTVVADEIDQPITIKKRLQQAAIQQRRLFTMLLVGK